MLSLSNSNKAKSRNASYMIMSSEIEAEYVDVGKSFNADNKDTSFVFKEDSANSSSKGFTRIKGRRRKEGEEKNWRREYNYRRPSASTVSYSQEFRKDSCSSTISLW
ncbi:hypothetical protein ACH5RR_023680 [Cinchona calisaya]|uniref:Uncharacterized protein n=1 Tax=Cinchona calisaya TaxID=153742 RepID=A0ABD2ZBE6_9GENT